MVKSARKELNYSYVRKNEQIWTCMCMCVYVHVVCAYNEVMQGFVLRQALGDVLSAFIVNAIESDVKIS